MLKLPVLLAAVLALTGCGSDIVVVSETCFVMERIAYDEALDSYDTVTQIQEHNAVLAALGCD